MARSFPCAILLEVAEDCLAGQFEIADGHTVERFESDLQLRGSVLPVGKLDVQVGLTGFISDSESPLRKHVCCLRSVWISAFLHGVGRKMPHIMCRRSRRLGAPRCWSRPRLGSRPALVRAASTKMLSHLSFLYRTRAN